jgi:hypothetical protein
MKANLFLFRRIHGEKNWRGSLILPWYNNMAP